MSRAQLAVDMAEFDSQIHDSEKLFVNQLLLDLNDETSGAIDKWSSVNIWESLKAQRILRGGNSNWIQRLLRDATSVLVFVPIALTWFTLWMAGEAFTKFLARHPNSEATFFELWQSGFSGYLNQEFYFSSYVLKTTFSILLMIVLFLAQNRYSDRMETRQEESFDEWNRLLSLLELELSVIRSENPRKFEGLLEQSATELRGLMAQGHLLVSAIKDEVGTIQNNIDIVNSASTALAETISTISSAQVEQANTFKNIHGSMERIGIEVASIPTALEAAIVTSFGVVNSALDSTTSKFTTQLENSLAAVKSVMESLSISQQTYISRGDEISLRLAEILAEIPGMKGRLEMGTMSSQADFHQANNASPSTGTSEGSKDGKI